MTCVSRMFDSHRFTRCSSFRFLYPLEYFPVQFSCLLAGNTWVHFFCYLLVLDKYPVGNYMFKFNNRNTRTRCEICSELTIKTPERHYWCRSSVFIVNFEHILHLVQVFLLSTLSRLILSVMHIYLI